MSYNSPNLIRSINNNQRRQNGKENNHSLSPNLRPVYNENKPIKNTLFPKNKMMYGNNNYNIKVNVINKKKENIIEGDLNFYDMPKQQKLPNTHKPNFMNNKTKNPRSMPRKSPLPIPRGFKSKSILNFNRIFTSKQRTNNQNIKKFNKTNNMFHPQRIIMKPNNNLFNGKLSHNTSKSFNFSNMKNDRSHSPILRSGQNMIMPLGVKPNTKIRYISKSPILGKSTAFNKNQAKFPVSLSGNPVVKKTAKKMPLPQQNNIPKKLNNINPSQKRNTVISGEISEDFLNQNQNQNKIGNNKSNNNSNNNGIIINNIKPMYRGNIPNNNYSKNNANNEEISHSFNIIRNESNNNNNIKNNTSNSANELPKPKETKEKISINNINNNINKPEEISNNKINKSENNNNNADSKNKNVGILRSNNNNNNNISNENKLEEKKNKKNTRSLSQTPLDPLKKNEEPEKKEKKEEKQVENESNSNKKVIKVIRDLLPYTHVGFDGEEPKENNQDNYFIFKNFAEHKDYIYMSVCDGHGVEGHFVSEFIKEVLPYYMSENLKERNILKETEIVHQIITETFLIVNNMLVDNESINSLFSGSTCVSVIFTPERLIVPNIGDSRAVLGRYDKATGKYKAIELSRDHKPTEKDEAQRIYDNDGRIQPFTEDGEFVGPQRVWIKDEEVPGLAMTRSFGDRVAATVGVMSEPEIKEFNFDENDKYMIIASDGIWEFISSQECIDMIQSYYESNDLKGCCEYLYQESSKRWLKEEEVIDDTTLILVFFE